MRLLHGKAEDMKVCTQCQDFAFGMHDILEKFGRDRRRMDGLQIYCKECRRQAAKTRYVRQKDVIGKPKVSESGISTG